MSNYYLYCVILEDCPFSIEAKKLLDSHNKFKKEINIIKYNDKEKYKTELINTFPQIYLKKYGSKGSQLIGGYTDIQYIFNKFYGKYNNNEVESFLTNNKSWSKKGFLRLIELINSK